jgi:hypothetical protein
MTSAGLLKSPCPRCGVPNYTTDPTCLTCGGELRCSSAPVKPGRAGSDSSGSGEASTKMLVGAAIFGSVTGTVCGAVGFSLLMIALPLRSTSGSAVEEVIGVLFAALLGSVVGGTGGGFLSVWLVKRHSAIRK